jgi:hypothetical protein
MCCPISDRVFQGIGSLDKVITVGHHVFGELDLGFAKPIIFILKCSSGFLFFFVAQISCEIAASGVVDRK